jgi:stage II sporulation protein M
LKDDLTYLGSIRLYIGLSIFIFALTTVMGYYTAAYLPEIASEWSSQLEMLKWILDQPPLLIMMIIFLKNLLACTVSVLLGLGLGLMPLIVVTSNGFLIGIVSYDVLQKEGLLYLLAGILPHGVIELPVVLLSIAVGFRLGYLVALSILGEKVDLTGEARTAVRLLFLRFMPLLLLAAFIETFITPLAISLAA